MYLNNISDELELQPNSLVKIEEINQFHNDLKKYVDSSEQYLIYLENDFIVKNFNMINNLSIIRFYDHILISIYEIYSGYLDLKKKELYIYDFYSNEELFQDSINLTLKSIDTKINQLKAKVKYSNSILCMDPISFLIKGKESMSEKISAIKIWKRYKKNLSTTLNYDVQTILELKTQKEKIDLFWRQCFKDRLKIINELEKHCIDINLNFRFVTRDFLEKRDVPLLTTKGTVECYISANKNKKFQFSTTDNGKETMQ